MQLSQTANTIIIAACSAFGGLVLLFVVFIFIRAKRRYSPVPLPPKQPLAHHREQQLAQLSERTGPSRPATWYNQPLLTPNGLPHAMSQASGSSASLLPNGNTSSNGHSPGVSEIGSPMETPFYTDMIPPVPSFHAHPASSSSSIASSDAGREVPISPSSSLPVPTPRPRASSSYSRVSRASSNSGNVTPRSTGATRGVPHSRYSTVQIILPTPLASQVQPYMPGQDPANQSRRSTITDGSRDRSSRYSMVDKWTPATTRTIDKERRRSVSAADPRTPANVRNSQLPPPSHNSRRVSSGSVPIFIQPNSREDLTLEAPPVPRIPSMYGGSSNDHTGESEQSDRGRAASINTPSIRREPTPTGEGKLRKRSRSRIRE